jgi:hypothetical protein
MNLPAWILDTEQAYSNLKVLQEQRESQYVWVPR